VTVFIIFLRTESRSFHSSYEVVTCEIKQENYFKNISAAEIKLFQHYFSDVEHVEKYS